MGRITTLVAALLATVVLAAPVGTEAKGSRASGGSHSATHNTTSHAATHSTTRSSSHNSHKAQGVIRDSHGRIARSSHAKHDFQKSHPCPSTGRSSGACPGYVVDHVQPLKRGGADSPSNMQWQTKQAAKEKDRTE